MLTEAWALPDCPPELVTEADSPRDREACAEAEDCREAELQPLLD
jgi:hypothetical protein